MDEFSGDVLFGQRQPKPPMVTPQSAGVLIDGQANEVLPEAVTVAEDELQTLSVAYGNMVGLLIEAVKELKAEVDTLKTEVAALKAG